MIYMLSQNISSLERFSSYYESGQFLYFELQHMIRSVAVETLSLPPHWTTFTCLLIKRTGPNGGLLRITRREKLMEQYGVVSAALSRLDCPKRMFERSGS